jgi:hypothetical protein
MGADLVRRPTRDDQDFVVDDVWLARPVSQGCRWLARPPVPSLEYE